MVAMRVRNPIESLICQALPVSSACLALSSSPSTVRRPESPLGNLLAQEDRYPPLPTIKRRASPSFVKLQHRVTLALSVI